MSSKITGKEYPLLKIFSFDFEYHIPAYQRPYAWITEEAGILFDDLYEFYRTELSDNYFLGTIVVNALLGCHDLDLSCCREIAGISVMECSI